MLKTIFNNWTHGILVLKPFMREQLKLLIATATNVNISLKIDHS